MCFLDKRPSPSVKSMTPLQTKRPRKTTQNKRKRATKQLKIQDTQEIAIPPPQTCRTGAKPWKVIHRRRKPVFVLVEDKNTHATIGDSAQGPSIRVSHT